MSDARSLPDHPSLDWLRKAAKRRLALLRSTDATARLADAQLAVAREHGFSSWRALKAHVDARSTEARLFNAAKTGDLATLRSLFDRDATLVQTRDTPYAFTLLHAAAQAGQVEVVDELIARGLDVNAREQGDNTTPTHWAAAAGHVEIVRRLADAGGDVVGRGDDHALEIIGWATCWEGCDDDRHRAVVAELLQRGASHHIFSAIAMDLADEVRRIVADDPSALNQRMSRNENHRLPLQFALVHNRPRMIELLLELGADPLGTDSFGATAATYVTERGADDAIMRRIRSMTLDELTSASRGHRPARIAFHDMLALVALHDWALAGRLVESNSAALVPGLLHLMAKRNDAEAVRWLVERGADVNALWPHWDSHVTPLHLAVFGNHLEMVRLLIAAGADPAVRDSKHDSDVLGWATFFKRAEIVEDLTRPRG